MKNKKQNMTGSTIFGFLILFFTIATVTSISVAIFHLVNIKTSGDLVAIIAVMVALVFVGTFICTLIDKARRKHLVEDPVSQILEATHKISTGNFDVKLKPKHSYDKYNEYDFIMENINIMASELSKNEILKNDFIANVSHEIKTPLAIIQNYTTMLSDKTIDEKTRNECLSALSNATKRLTSLVTGILKLNKLEHQQTLPNLSAFNLGESLRQNVIEFENLIEEKNLELDCNIDDVIINSSEEYLNIVWNNLLSNAIKFTKHGKISVSLKEIDGNAIIKIKDTGIGMNSEVGNHIFEKFYQGDTSHSFAGNGLGLALVKRVIDILGGEISVESAQKKGSTFTVKISKG